MNSNKRQYCTYVIVVCLLLMVLYCFKNPSAYLAMRDFFSNKPVPPIEDELSKKDDVLTVQREPWITVFIHGSFGPLIGLLSFSRVLKDDLYGSLYKDINKRMRQDPFFYKDQAMLQRGLVPISPTFNIRQADNKKCAAFPIIKAYDIVQNIVKPGKEQNYFYTFGWSGLMSQHRRRLEAVRLYNGLCEELEKFKQKGITPKIRILAHSHGGNLCLNIAAINHAMKGTDPLTLSHEGYRKETTDSLQKMVDLIKKLPEKPKTTEVKGQRYYDYAPLCPSLHINELIILGTPVQPETEFFCLSDTFEKFYHFYSEEDAIQKLDGFTTKQYKSEQRLPDELFSCVNSGSKITQAKIMYERMIIDQQVPGVSVAITQPIAQEKQESFWQKLSGLFSIFSKKFQDPGHKELWFVSWKHDGENNCILSPLPAVILTPLIILSLEQLKGVNDVDVNVALAKNNLDITTFKHNDNKIRQHVTVPVAVINQLKEKFKPWNPQDLLESSGMEGIYKHLM